MANILKNNTAKEYTQPDIKIYYKPTVIKTVKCWHKNRKINLFQTKTSINLVSTHKYNTANTDAYFLS